MKLCGCAKASKTPQWDLPGKTNRQELQEPKVCRSPTPHLNPVAKSNFSCYPTMPWCDCLPTDQGQ